MPATATSGAMLRESLSREFDFAAEDAFGFGGLRYDRIVAGTLARIAAGNGARNMNKGDEQ